MFRRPSFANQYALFTIELLRKYKFVQPTKHVLVSPEIKQHEVIISQWFMGSLSFLLMHQTVAATKTRQNDLLSCVISAFLAKIGDFSVLRLKSLAKVYVFHWQSLNRARAITYLYLAGLDTYFENCAQRLSPRLLLKMKQFIITLSGQNSFRSRQMSWSLCEDTDSISRDQVPATNHKKCSTPGRNPNRSELKCN